MDKMSGTEVNLHSAAAKTNGVHKANGTAFKKVEPYDYELTKEDELLPNRIADTFDGKKILITGGTGFLGKVMLEKLLRVCHKVDTVYLLIREKKGKVTQERAQELFNSPLFDHLKSERGVDEISRKVVGITGDVSLLDLGLSPADRELLCNEVNIVYHAAASIRFDEALKKAVLLNARGTRLMLELGKEMKKLELFCHVSTAYCHLHERVLYERPYDPPADPHKIIRCVEWMEDSVVEAMTKEILGGLPNTYAFTKALSEGLVNEQMDNMPVIILRPSIVIPIWKDPLPGWTDNINGPTGLLIGAGKGVIRTMYCKQEGYADYLPVDVAVNGMYVATWNYIVNKKTEIKVFHMTSSSEIQVSWAEIITLGRKVTERVPLNGIVWYPGGSLKKSKTLHMICVFLFHLLPAIILDCLIYLAGYPPVLMRVQRRITKGFEVFEYYANNQWDFKNDQVVLLRKEMNAKERKVFKIDGDGLDMEDYFEKCVLAAREYILNEPNDQLPAARRHLRIMWWVDVITKMLFFSLFVYYMFTFIQRYI